nr:MAG TPA: hypothetical protein [Caudoviricetes sp.]
MKFSENWKKLFYLMLLFEKLVFMREFRMRLIIRF